MAKTLGAFLFIREGELYDYPYKEVISSLCEFCDEVSVSVVDGDDDTWGEVEILKFKYSNLK